MFIELTHIAGFKVAVDVGKTEYFSLVGGFFGTKVSFQGEPKCIYVEEPPEEILSKIY